MTYSTRPLSDRTWLQPSKRRRSPFTAGWGDTLSLLEREVAQLGGRNLVIEVDVREQDFKLNGELRANARPTDPAVRIAFASRAHGDLIYQCDAFNQLGYGSKAVHPWQDNVRAIAFKLEALRAVDRYSASGRGEQYTGFRAIGGRSMGGGSEPTLTSSEAYAVFCTILGSGSALEYPPTDPRTIRAVKKAAHPDANGGDTTLWEQATEAARALAVTL